jgi:hypothetical protein
MMSLWADDATFTNKSTGTTYVGFDNIKTFWQSSGSFTHHRDRGRSGLYEPGGKSRNSSRPARTPRRKVQFRSSGIYVAHPRSVVAGTCDPRFL